MRYKIILGGVALMATLLPAADNNVCTVANFQGTYAFQSTGINVMTNLPVTFVGTIRADGNGAITAWVDSMATPEQVPVPPALKGVRPFTDIDEKTGRDIRYVVEPDCRITISGTIQTSDGRRIPLIHAGALADGGREALLMSTSSGAHLITTTMKRAEDTSREELMDLLRKIANRLGLITQ